MSPILKRWLPHAAFAVVALGAAVLLSGNRYFAFFNVGITMLSELWSGTFSYLGAMQVTLSCRSSGLFAR